MRLLWAAFGWLAVGLALAGIPLPFLPTTPFLLLAAFCFARSSPRLHAWLLNHPQLGPVIRDWNERGAIPKRGKILAVVMMAASLGLTWLAGAPWFVVTGQAVILSLVAAYLVTRPSA